MKYPWEKEYSISLKMLLKIYVSTHLNLSLDHLSVQVGLGLIKPLSGGKGANVMLSTLNLKSVMCKCTFGVFNNLHLKTKQCPGGRSNEMF